MLPWMKREFHNASSVYFGARKARVAIDESRDLVSGTLGCLSGEVVFTSGGTESANLAILGTCLSHRGGKRNRVLFSAAEHECVLAQRKLLLSFGFVVELLPVLSDGSIDVASLKANLNDDVLLVSAMHANNETGAISDVESVGRICREIGAFFFCDCVQTFGTVPFTVDSLFADLISVSAHKLYGPKGVGALFVRAGTKLQPLQLGGGQERELRAGTENVAGIVGFGEAVGLAINDKDRPSRTSSQKSELAKLLSGKITECHSQLPGHLHLHYPGARAESVLINLDRLGVDASSGSACSSGSIEASHVLLAAGWSQENAAEALRFTVGKNPIDVTVAAETIEKAVSMSRN